LPPRARAIYDKAAKERQDEGRKHSHESRKGLVPVNFPEPNKGDARDQVAKAFGISGRTVDFARKVQEHGIPELVQAVDEGRMAVSTAAILATEPEEVQRRECANPKRNRKYTPGPGGAGEPISRQEPDQEEPKPKRNGKPPVGVILANEALNVLMRIPKNDPLRKRGFQIVVDWIRTNS